MYDRTLALDILKQIQGALQKTRDRTAGLSGVEDLTATAAGEERLDGLRMLFVAIGESLKNLDKITGGELLPQYPEVDWKGAMGFRDVVAHRYFDIDAEQVWWVCSNEVGPLSDIVRRMIADLGA